MDEQTLLRLITTHFDEINIAYMVTGSIAVSYYGIPRATHDIDLVVAVTLQDAEKISAAFLNNFYVSDIKEAIRHRQMFNLIDQTSQIKIDCWVLDTTSAYYRKAFERRQSVPLSGKQVKMISKEDLILSKLLRYKEAQSDIHLRDVRGIVGVQGMALDMRYIDEWCDRLSLNRLWEDIRRAVLK